jgi:hypothetical protein
VKALQLNTRMCASDVGLWNQCLKGEGVEVVLWVRLSTWTAVCRALPHSSSLTFDLARYISTMVSAVRLNCSVMLLSLGECDEIGMWVMPCSERRSWNLCPMYLPPWLECRY